MNIQDALKKAREKKMAIRKSWWPEGYFLTEDGAFLIGNQGELYRFDIESLLSKDWVVTTDNKKELNAEVSDHNS